MEVNENVLQTTWPLKEEEDLTNSFVDMNLNDCEDAPYAPAEIFAEFLSTLMCRDYQSALYYCSMILEYEPDNKTVLDFYPLIQEKLGLVTEDSDEEFGECADENCNNTRSESSTEYFSNCSAGAENTLSMCSSFSSEEDDLSIKSCE